MTTEERLELVFAEARRLDGQAPRPRFSNAAGCIRQHVYEELAVRSGVWRPEEDRPVRWNAAAACGHAIGALLEAAAARVGAKSQVPAMLDADGRAVEIIEVERNGEVVTEYDGTPAVKGSADIVWPDAVWDLKCVGDSSWYRVKKEPDPKHVIQVNGYAHALSLPKWVLVYIYLGSIGRGRDLKYLFHEGETDAELAEAIAQHWQQVKEYADAKKLPERPYKPGSFECVVCSYNQQCHGDVK